MKIRYLRLKSLLLVGIASLLGINLGCDKSENMAEEYGCPNATFKVKGAVVDENGNPIEGIGVGSRDMTRTSPDGVVMPGIEYRDTTDANGQFEVVYEGYRGMGDVNVDFRDIDLDPRYRDTVVRVSFEGARFVGGDGWYDGMATREIEVEMRAE